MDIMLLIFNSLKASTDWDSRDMAEKRFLSLGKKFAKLPELCVQYVRFDLLTIYKIASCLPQNN